MKEIELLKIIFKDSPDILEPLNEIDKEIERLKNKIHEVSEIQNELYNERTDLKNKNNNLNNIINELEKRIVMKTNSDFIDTKVKDVCCEFYQILQELKGGSSNE